MKFSKLLAFSLFLVSLVPSIQAGDCDCRPAKPNQQVVTVCVDRTRTPAQLVAEGGYDWVSLNVNTFGFAPGLDAVETDIVLIGPYGHSMSSEQVLADMDRQGLRPATTQELLSLGAKRKELPENGTAIVALGTVVQVDGHRSVAYLSRHDAERHLILYWFDDEWGGFCRFAGVRK